MRDSGHVDVGGPMMPSTTHPHRSAAIDAVTAVASRLGRPVRAEAVETDGTVWQLAVAPNGAVGEFVGEQGTRAPERRDTAAPAPAPPTRHRPQSLTQPRSQSHGQSHDFADTLILVTGHLDAGRVEMAVELATELDELAADSLGVSHPDALRIREIRARATALAGDPEGGVRLFRDVAERWHYKNESGLAEAAAQHAESLWPRITDLETALSAGLGLVRLRNQMPGQDGAALAAVIEHLSWLEWLRHTAHRPGGTATGPVHDSTPAPPPASVHTSQRALLTRHAPSTAAPPLQP
ncbi:hypothetical protein [Streptomyces sp. NPDC017991]|uniref:hypothetical protein n=1 Tax=Streptomyces sp. NPDC017991 TaxID=3365026 RepID=UPI003795BEF8